MKSTIFTGLNKRVKGLYARHYSWMKKTVFDIDELQKLIPLFRGRIGRFLGKLTLKYLCIDKVNTLHSTHCHKRGAEFTSAVLSDPSVNIRYHIHNKELLDNLPEGAFVTVSNHPIGSIDGVMLIDIFASRRPDFKVMVNGFLECIGALENNFIPVKPDSKREKGNIENVNGVRACLAWLKEGHPLGFFPAGAISSYRKDKKEVCDLPWAENIIRLVRKTKVPVYPVLFDCYNSRFFYWLGKLSWKIRQLRIPAEVFNKKGKVMNIYIGRPITPEAITGLSDKELSVLLYNHTYKLK